MVARDQQSRAAFLRRSTWSEGLAPAQTEQLAANAAVVKRARGAVLWDAQEPARGVWWIRSGSVRFERDCHGGRSLILAFCGRGDAFGIESVVQEGPRGYRAVAHENCVAFEFPADVIRGLDVAQPATERRLVARYLAQRQRVEARIADLVFQPVLERVRAALADLAIDFGVPDSRGVIIDLRLTQRELGDMVGTSREGAGLALQQLREEGWIAPQDRRIVLARAVDAGPRPRARRARV